MQRPRLSHNDHPSTEFTHDVEEVKADQIVGGLGEKSDLIVSKSVFPAFRYGQEVRFRAHLALFLVRIKPRRALLDAINTGITIKGIGNIDSLPILKQKDLLAQGGDLVAGQVGLGGIFGISAAAIRKYQGVADQETKVFNLRSSDKTSRGNIRITNKLLSKTSYLRKSLIPSSLTDSLDEEISAVVFSEILAHFTVEQVNQIINDSSNVNRNYREPRLVIRLNVPHDQLDSLGNRPGAFMASSYQTEGGNTPEAYYAPINIIPSRYDKQSSAREEFFAKLAESLGVSDKKIINFWPLRSAEMVDIPTTKRTSKNGVRKMTLQEGIDNSLGIENKTIVEKTEAHTITTVNLDGVDYQVMIKTS